MRKGDRRKRLSPRTAAETACARWMARYTTAGERLVARYAFHAGVRWCRQDERRRRSTKRVAALVKGREG